MYHRYLCKNILHIGQQHRAVFQTQSQLFSKISWRSMIVKVREQVSTNLLVIVRAGTTNKIYSSSILLISTIQFRGAKGTLGFSHTPVVIL